MGESDDEETSVTESSLLFIVKAGELRNTINASECFELSPILKINTHIIHMELPLHTSMKNVGATLSLSSNVHPSKCMCQYITQVSQYSLIGTSMGYKLGSQCFLYSTSV
jgi:hypothetical protein